MKEENLFSEFPPVSKEEWKNAIEKELKGKPFDSLIWKTEEGFDLMPFYTHADLINSKSKIQNPKSQNDWEIRENIVVSDAKTTNKKALEVLNSGVNSPNFILTDLKGFKNLSGLLKDILPEYISLNFTCEKNPLQILKWFKKFAGSKKQNIRGSIIFSPFENKKLKKDVFDICSELFDFSPLFRGITISVYEEKLITKQLSSALSKGNFILKNLIQNRFSIDEISARIQFSFPVSNNYFLEIAKIRTMRILWAGIVQQYKPKHECSVNTFFHSEISPDKNSNRNNIFISNTTRVMSAAIGGANSISIISNDEFLERINRNIQLIAKEEAYINGAIDAANGSYYIEVLTGKICEAVWKKFKR